VRKTNEINGLVNVFRKICAVFYEMNVILFNVCNGLVMIRQNSCWLESNTFLQNFLVFSARKNPGKSEKSGPTLRCAGCPVKRRASV